MVIFESKCGKSARHLGQRSRAIDAINKKATSRASRKKFTVSEVSEQVFDGESDIESEKEDNKDNNDENEEKLKVWIETLEMPGSDLTLFKNLAMDQLLPMLK